MAHNNKVDNENIEEFQFHGKFPSDIFLQYFAVGLFEDLEMVVVDVPMFVQDVEGDSLRVIE